MVQEELKATRSEAINHKCHDCCGEYYDGKDDCEIVSCPLYSFMPYRTRKPDLEWTKYNPRMKGMVLKEDSVKVISDEQRQAMSDRLKIAREKRSLNSNETNDSEKEG
jgi:hypothetical protein